MIGTAVGIVAGAQEPDAVLSELVAELCVDVDVGVVLDTHEEVGAEDTDVGGEEVDEVVAVVGKKEEEEVVDDEEVVPIADPVVVF